MNKEARAALIKLASSLPQGSDERKTILSSLSAGQKETSSMEKEAGLFKNIAPEYALEKVRAFMSRQLQVYGSDAKEFCSRLEQNPLRVLNSSDMEDLVYFGVLQAVTQKMHVYSGATPEAQLEELQKHVLRGAMVSGSEWVGVLRSNAWKRFYSYLEGVNK